jgi:predicted metal-binding protein
MAEFSFTYQSKVFKTKELLPYFKGDELTNLCKKGCPNFNRCWSCPPFSPNFYQLSTQYCFIELYLVIAKPMDTSNANSKNIDKAYGYLNEKVISDIIPIKNNGIFLANFPCKICPSCTAPDYECRFPDQMYYDITGTGLHLVDIMKDKFHYTIQWPKNGSIPGELAGICGRVFNDTARVSGQKK